MDNRMLIPLTIICVIGLFTLLLLQFLPSNAFSAKETPAYIRNVDVRGMSITHKGTQYTLNFEQQNQTLKYLNQAVPVSKADYEKSSEALPFSKLTIFLFKGSDIEINPVGYRGENLVFYTPSWHQGNYLIELSGGELKSLLAQTFDP